MKREQTILHIRAPLSGLVSAAYWRPRTLRTAAFLIFLPFGWAILSCILYSIDGRLHEIGIFVAIFGPILYLLMAIVGCSITVTDRRVLVRNYFFTQEIQRTDVLTAEKQHGGFFTYGRGTSFYWIGTVDWRIVNIQLRSGRLIAIGPPFPMNNLADLKLL